MATLFICHDKGDSSALREQYREAHFAYIERVMDQLLMAGPLDSGQEGGPTGSLFIYATDDPERATQLLHNDPYFTAGIYGSVDMRQFLPAAGTWIGGGIWQEGVTGPPGRTNS